jgi:hypothetical protein
MWTHCAPTERGEENGFGFYKHSAPTEPEKHQKTEKTD